MQVLVVGAGVVGLAVARAAAMRGHEVVVAEATGGIGNGVSSRNSEVVHAGTTIRPARCGPAIPPAAGACSTILCLARCRA